MLISRPLLAQEARLAEATRHYNMSQTLSTRNSVTSHPRPEYYPPRDNTGHSFAGYIPPPTLHDASWPRNNIAADYRTHVMNNPLGLHEYKIAAQIGARFTPANLPSPEEDPFEKTDPYLSAMPHRQQLMQHPQAFTVAEPPWGTKRRRLDDTESREQHESSVPQVDSLTPGSLESEGDREVKGADTPPRTLDHYNAAMVLVKLSSKDNEETATEEDQMADDTVPGQRLAIEPICLKKRQRARSL